MRTDFSRKRQQLFRHFRIDIRDRNILRDRRALAVALQVGPEAAGLQFDAVAEILRAFARLPFGSALAEPLGVLAFRIVGASDESSELAASKREPSGAALGTETRVGSGAFVGEQPRSKKLVEGRGNLRRLLVHDFTRLGPEVAPEILEQLVPLEPPAGDIVQLILELGSVVVADVFLEKPLEEGRHQPPALLGHEARLFDPDIFAVLQGLQDRGVG